MTATNHVLTGAIIGAVIHQPVLALPLALASHFMLDALPHFGIDEHRGTKFFGILMFDGFLAATLLIAIAVWQPRSWPLMIACGILAASPDLMWVRYLVAELKHHPRKLGRVATIHAKIQWGERETGWPYELIWLALGLPILVHIAA